MVNLSHAVVDSGQGEDRGKIACEISERFGAAVDEGDDFSLKIEIAKWHLDNKRGLTAIITLTECILDYFSEASGIPRDTRDDDSALRRAITDFHFPNSLASQFVAKYRDELRGLRNEACHNLTFDKYKELELLYNYFSSVYNEHFKNNDDNYANLQKGFPQK